MRLGTLCLTFLIGLALPAVSLAQAPDPEVQIRLNESATLARLRQVISAVEIYKRRYSTYPRGLAQLGPPEEGEPSADAANLISTTLARGETGSGYLLTYTAKDATAEGSFVSWELEALPEIPRVTGRRHFISDESGALHHALDRRATAKDPPVDERGEPREGEPTPLAQRNEKATRERIGRLLVALQKYHARFRFYPAALAHLGPPGEGPTSRLAAGLISAQLARGVVQGYIYIYQGVPDANGMVHRYELQVRPEIYGKSGGASFWTDQTGTLRGTRENRSARPSDPAVE